MLSTCSKPSAGPYTPHTFFRGFGTQDSTNYEDSTLLPLLALLLANKPASELSNECLLTIVSSQDSLWGPTGRFYTYSESVQVVSNDQTVQCEHINRELWLYIVADLLIQCELELNNIYKIVQCMPSFNNALQRH